MDINCTLSHSETTDPMSAYGTARGLARQLGEMEAARLLSHTLGEEQSADFLLTAIADPLLQDVTFNDLEADVDPETVGVGKEDKPGSCPNRFSQSLRRRPNLRDCY